jgi:molybdopterin/thiamine biosynthesis adenylyltransferase
MFSHDLVFTARAYFDLIRRLRPPGRAEERLPCGVARMPDRWEWLISGPRAESPESPVLVALRGSHPEMLADTVRLAAARERAGNRVILGVGVGPAAGYLAGLVCCGHYASGLDTVRVIAPGLPRLVLGAGRSEPQTATTPTDLARFSRTIGALDGRTFDRLRSLRLAVVGCGRTGSLVVDHLSAHGVASLALIDPDVIERHNLGEMSGELDADLGRPKAVALAERVDRRGLGTVVTAVTAPVQSLDALFALKPADVLVSCPDNPSARRTVACAAALYLKPVLDIGTGILLGQAGRETGLDVRWLLPGRCVNCVGERVGSPTDPPRLGSLRSVNTWAVGVGFTLLEQFLVGVVSESVWVQGDVGVDGIPRLGRTNLPPRSDCRICALSGRGDEGLDEASRVISAIA